MPTTLAERLQKLERRRAQLAESEAILKEKVRKGRTRQLIAAGAEVEKAGLLKLSPEALYGALLSLAAGAADPRTVRAWEKAAKAGALTAAEPPAEEPPAALPAAAE